MSSYLIVASRDPLEFQDGRFPLESARKLAARGHEVHLFLIENGVFFARRSPDSGLLDQLGDQGVRILAEDVSLRQRGIGPERIAPQVEVADLDVFLDLLMEKCERAFWH